MRRSRSFNGAYRTRRLKPTRETGTSLPSATTRKSAGAGKRAAPSSGTKFQTTTGAVLEALVLTRVNSRTVGERIPNSWKPTFGISRGLSAAAAVRVKSSNGAVKRANRPAVIALSIRPTRSPRQGGKQPHVAEVQRFETILH